MASPFTIYFMVPTRTTINHTTITPVATMNARQKMESYKDKHPDFYPLLKANMEPILEGLGL